MSKADSEKYRNKQPRKPVARINLNRKPQGDELNQLAHGFGEEGYHLFKKLLVRFRRST